MSTTTPEFDHVLALTGKTDYCALTLHMLEFMRALRFIRDVTVYEVFRNTARQDNRKSEHIYRRFNHDLSAARASEILPGLDRCMAGQEPTEFLDEAGWLNLIIPIRSKSGPTRLFYMQTDDLDTDSRTYVINMLLLYQNQVHLLDAKERDALTGLLNRQTLAEHMQMLATLHRETHAQSWLAVLDIDHFKRVNDTHGHLYGDEVLLHFSQMMDRCFRYTDYLFRFGGEEFVVLLTDTNAADVVRALERFRTNISAHDFPIDDQITVSIGYTEIREGILPTTLFDQADQSLYEAKSTGRNRVVGFEVLKQAADSNNRSAELF